MPAAEPPPPAAVRRSARLRVATRRVPRVRPADGVNGEVPAESEPEPNMRLSRALVVMLLFHLVAVGGVFAFSFIKERPAAAKTLRRGPAGAPAAAQNSGTPASPPDSGAHRIGRTLPNESAPATPAPAAQPPANTNNVGRPRAVQEPRPADRAAPAPTPAPLSTVALPSGKPALSRPETDALRLIEGAGPRETGAAEKTYTVGKGETASAIAQKLKLNYDNLLRINGIEDPKKIHAGQKLLLPPSAKTKS